MGAGDHEADFAVVEVERLGPARRDRSGFGRAERGDQPAAHRVADFFGELARQMAAAGADQLERLEAFSIGVRGGKDIAERARRGGEILDLVGRDPLRGALDRGFRKTIEPAAREAVEAIAVLGAGDQAHHPFEKRQLAIDVVKMRDALLPGAMREDDAFRYAGGARREDHAGDIVGRTVREVCIARRRAVTVKQVRVDGNRGPSGAANVAVGEDRGEGPRLRQVQIVEAHRSRAELFQSERQHEVQKRILHQQAVDRARHDAGGDEGAARIVEIMLELGIADDLARRGREDKRGLVRVEMTAPPDPVDKGHARFHDGAPDARTSAPSGASEPVSEDWNQPSVSASTVPADLIAMAPESTIRSATPGNGQ